MFAMFAMFVGCCKMLVWLCQLDYITDFFPVFGSCARTVLKKILFNGHMVKCIWLSNSNTHTTDVISWSQWKQTQISWIMSPEVCFCFCLEEEMTSIVRVGVCRLIIKLALTAPVVIPSSLHFILQSYFILVIIYIFIIKMSTA